jgi:hypothetical protein
VRERRRGKHTVRNTEQETAREVSETARTLLLRLLGCHRWRLDAHLHPLEQQVRGAARRVVPPTRVGRHGARGGLRRGCQVLPLPI